MYIKGLVDILKKDNLDAFQGKDFFLITHFEETQEYYPGYDLKDQGGYSSVTRIRQYATCEQDVLEKAILQLTEKKASFVFCKSKIGGFKINTTVDIL